MIDARVEAKIEMKAAAVERLQAACSKLETDAVLLSEAKNAAEEELLPP